MNKKTAKFLIREAQQIKARLAEIGWSLSDIDRHYKLPRGSAGEALRSPNKGGEEAIADALDVKPHTLWSQRYDPDTGHRYEPQPRANYRRPPTLLQRRKSAEVRT